MKIISLISIWWEFHLLSNRDEVNEYVMFFYEMNRLIFCDLIHEYNNIHETFPRYSPLSIIVEEFFKNSSYQ